MPTLDTGSDFVANTKAKASEVNTRFNNIETWANVTKLDGANLQNDIIALAHLASDLEAKLQEVGANVGTGVHRGKSIITAEGSLTSTSFGQLNNGPDQVANVVVPANGLLRVQFSALVKAPGANNVQAAIFIGANQLKVPVFGQTAPQTQAARVGSDNYVWVKSCPVGLFGTTSPDLSDVTSVTTGEALGALNASASQGAYMMWGGSNIWDQTTADDAFGGPCLIRGLPAANYTVSVQFKSENGGQSVLAKERELWVEAVGF